MISKKLLISLLSVAVAFMAVICLVITLTLSGNDEKLKINQSQIEIGYGETFNLDKIIHKYDKLRFKIDDTSVAKIENNKIVTVSLGETKLFVSSKNSYNKEIKIIIYASTASFDKQTIDLHTSGADTYADFCLYVNNIPYNNATYTYDDNIINIENNRIYAKTAGKTQISTTILGNLCNITATLDVIVSNYVYAENIIEDKINLNINQSVSKQFLQYENKTGDKISADISYDEEYLSYENGILTARKVGSTEIYITTLKRDGSTLSRVIFVEISPALDINNYSFYQSNSNISALHYSTKADGTLENYVLKVAFNKPINAEPTFNGIEFSKIQTTDNQNFEVSFTKFDNSNISLTAVDPNTNTQHTFTLQIPLVEFIQGIGYSLVDSDEIPRDCLYIFNDNYETEANNDGYYNSLTIKTNDNVTISTKSSLIEITGTTVRALSCGTAQITLTATDGSGVVCEKNISINIVAPTAINFAKAQDTLFLYDKISLLPTYSPIYAIADFAITFDDNLTTSQYFSNANYDFQATKCGSCKINICENNSKISHMYSFTILQEIIFKYNNIIYDGSEKLTINADACCISILKRTLEYGELKTTTDLQDVIIKIFGADEKLLYSNENGAPVGSTSPVAKIENELCFSSLSSETLTLQILKGNKIVATLIIYKL